jgi:hypothetical protein
MVTTTPSACPLPALILDRLHDMKKVYPRPTLRVEISGRNAKRSPKSDPSFCSTLFSPQKNSSLPPIIPPLIRNIPPIALLPAAISTHRRRPLPRLVPTWHRICPIPSVSVIAIIRPRMKRSAIIVVFAIVIIPRPHPHHLRRPSLHHDRMMTPMIVVTASARPAPPQNR